MDREYRNLNDFLKLHKTTEKQGVTHTRIGDVERGVFPGKYIIPHDKQQIFYKLYNRHVFVDHNPEYLTEVQFRDGTGPILVDFDFRYAPETTTRQHTSDHLYDIADQYMEQINKLCTFVDGDIVNVFMFEKDSANTTSDKVTKDGIHMVISIQMDHLKQQILRNMILRVIGNQFDNLLLINEYESVLDEGISKGHTNWQMYGSKKPGNEAYKVVKYFQYTYDSDDAGFAIEVLKLSKLDDLCLMSMVSARSQALIESPLRDEYKTIYDSMKSASVKSGSKAIRNKHKLNKHNISVTIDEIISVEQISDLLEHLLNSSPDKGGLRDDEYHVKETHQFAMCLPKKYYNDYSEWIRVGWALRNCDYRLFLSWMLFSSQSDKFNFGDIGENLERWNSFQGDNEGLTARSIQYWAKSENPSEYKEIYEKSVEYYMHRSIGNQDEQPPMEWEIAVAIYHMYKHKYRCASIKSKTWYKFEGNRWVENEEGCELRNNISKVVARRYGALSSRYAKKSCEMSTDDPKAHETVRKKAARFSNICTKLKTTTFKANVMRECATVFYNEDGDFLKLLDENRHLMGFNNGVYDFTNKQFRMGRADDYISLSTNIDHCEIDNNNPKHTIIIDEINDFMEKLFPNPDLRKYVWDHLGSVLIGGNKPQTFNIYIGIGRNGKSKLVELMSMVLGDYKGTLPSSHVTTFKRSGSGALSPEIAILKGIRYAVLQEISKGEKLNDGVMKELTGGDEITARSLFKMPITFLPQFKLVVATNSLFDIKTTDDGTWRRIRNVDFVSKFEDNPQRTVENPHVFLKDPDIDEKFKAWSPIFMSMLIQVANENNGLVPDCDIVKQSSDAYRHDQDYLSEFFDEKIKKSDGSTHIKKTELFETFGTWYKENYGKRLPPGKELYGYVNSRIGKYKPGHGWVGYQIIYEQTGDVDDEEEFEI